MIFATIRCSSLQLKIFKMKEYQVNFQTYQNFLVQTKDIFNGNYAIKIEPVKNFEKNFSNENAKAFKFTKFRSIAFLLVFLVALIIILTPVIIGLIFFYFTSFDSKF